MGVNQRHDICLLPHQLLFLETPLHDFQGLKVLPAGVRHAVALIIPHAFHVMGAGGEEDGRFALGKGDAVEIIRCP